jgi:hypothetical protein
MNLLLLTIALATSPADVPKPTVEVRQEALQLADGGVRLPPRGVVADGGVRLPPRGAVADGGVRLPPRGVVADGGVRLPPRGRA